MMLVIKKSVMPNGKTPLLLYVYGGFNTPMLPHYVEGLIPWLDNGGMVAIPHLRGGGEYGEDWHQAGMGKHKQNTFDDAVAAAAFLIKEGYTIPDRLAIQGASNGGLTAAAAITLRPDLFRAAVLKNPLTDMVRYPLFGQGKAWVPEYGTSPYSPYHHIKPGTQYPATLILAADYDDRVDPMHSRKFAAALQASRPPDSPTTSRPTLFRSYSASGHAGTGYRNAEVEEWTDRLQFLSHEISQSAMQ